MSIASSSPLIWIDLEMTGLEPDSCVILEIATVVTDAELRVLASGPDIVIHHPDEVLDAMGEWCKDHHGKSGLTQQVQGSTISLAEAERQTVAFLREHVDDGASPICGNSVDLDWRFIRRYMPDLANVLKPQILDVSSIKEMVKRWYPALPAFEKKGSHRALDDILESIDELRFYRQRVFLPTAERGTAPAEVAP